mgnify:CR=1 FL=1
MYMHGNETEHAAARLMSMVSVVTFVVLWWLKKTTQKESSHTRSAPEAHASSLWAFLEAK